MNALERYVYRADRVANILPVAPAAPGADLVHWQDLSGVTQAWGPVERITYTPTLGEQYLAQKGLKK